MKISDDAKNRLMHTLHPLLRNDGTGEIASQLMQNVANDAEDDDGRWVTTEEGNHMFIDGEGEPTKGNPYVLAAAKGEKANGSSTGSKDYPMGRSKLRSSGKYTRKQLIDEYKKLIDEKGGINKITNAESDEIQKKLGVSSEEWNNARSYWYAGPGSKKLESKSNANTSSKNKQPKNEIKVEPYTGKRSGDKALDKQFDNTRQAYAEWKAAEADEEKALKSVAKKHGLIKNTRGSVSYQDRAKIRALKDPDLVSAEKAMQKAMNKHIRETGKLKDLYSNYRKNGGEQIRDYYSAASEWDDND